MSDEFLSPKQFRDQYGPSERTTARWRVTGDGPPFVRVGPRTIRYRLADCERWAAERTYRHRAEELASQCRPDDTSWVVT